MGNSKAWNFFMMLLNWGFALWWSLDLTVQLLLFLRHDPRAALWKVGLDVFFGVLSVFFATQYQRQLRDSE